MNNKKINKIIQEIEDYLADTNKHLPVDEDALKNQKDKQYVISFILEQIANESVNLANHIASELDLETPNSSKEVFDVLAKANIITKENSDKMKDLISIRNVIAHRYTNISFEILAENVNNLGYVEDFLNQINKKLNSMDNKKAGKT